MIYKRIEKVEEDELRSILKDLPEWFGIEETLDEYVKESMHNLMFGCYDNEDLLGFVTMKQTSSCTLEIYVMGIKHLYHRLGIGKTLFGMVKAYAIQQGVTYLQVKTLDPAVKDKDYLKTYYFYEKMGFMPVEVLPLWDEWNPCMLMIQKVEE